MVEEFGEGFGETVGDGLNHDRFVNIVSFTKFGCPFIGTVDADDEATEVVVFFGNIITEGEVGFASGFFLLLAQGMKDDL